MTTLETIPPFANVLIVAGTSVRRAFQAMTRLSIFAARNDESALNILDQRGLADVGFARIDFSTEDGAAIQRALIKIYEW